jgi:hypothetical protein
MKKKTEYYKNPNKASESRLEAIKENLRKLGDLSGITVDLNTNEIITGNQRSKIIDINKCEVKIITDYKTPTDQD